MLILSSSLAGGVMATLHKEIHIVARPELIWDAARDIGALHTRLVPGFVVNTQLEGKDARIVTFGNGLVVRELIVSVDDARRRLAWTASGGRTTHYNAVLEVLADRAGTRVVWTIDLLPDEMAEPIAAMQESGLTAMKATFERAA
jgi:Polyketide cyclase / dehydrase and lipid transport